MKSIIRAKVFRRTKDGFVTLKYFMITCFKMSSQSEQRHTASRVMATTEFEGNHLIGQKQMKHGKYTPSFRR